MLGLLLLLVLIERGVTTSASFHSDDDSLGKQKRSMLEDDPCLDSRKVDNMESVEFLPRYAGLKRPWLRSDIKPKLYTSNGLHYQWTWAKSLPVRGLRNGATVDDVIRFLDGQNCTFLAIGDVVWKSLQMARPVKIDGEISCPVQKLYATCIKKYGRHACGLFPVEGEHDRYRLEIGDARWNRSLDSLRAEPLVLHEWGSTLGLPPHRWSYTMTTMAIFDDNAGHVIISQTYRQFCAPVFRPCHSYACLAAGYVDVHPRPFSIPTDYEFNEEEVYLVDMTGRGYTDTCGKKLIAATEESKWKEWGDDDLMKMYRFYLFRMLGFGVANHDLQNHINNEIERNSSKKVAQTFYCEYILNGVISWAGDEFTSACHLVFPETADRKRIARAKEIMQNEMTHHWNGFMNDVIDDMEAVYLTERQFVDVHNRLRQRHSADLVNTAPGVMHLGEPLANDIADVHRKPILTRSETTDGELLRDFGDVPEVDSEGEQDFSSAFLPVGAGYNHPETVLSSETHDPKREAGGVEIVNLEDETSQAETFSTSTPQKGSKLSEKERTTATNAHRTSQFSSQQSLCPHKTFVQTAAAMAVYYSLFL